MQAGKLVYGMVVDLPAIGGRVAFLYCMLGTGLCTAAMSLCDSEMQLALAWGLARATQAAGWIGMVKIVVAWTPASRLGRVMALCSLATYVGDFATRLLIGAVLAGGVGWRSVFWLSGAVIGVLFVGTVALLKPSPESLGLPKVAANPHRVVEAEVSTAAAIFLAGLRGFTPMPHCVSGARYPRDPAAAVRLGRVLGAPPSPTPQTLVRSSPARAAAVDSWCWACRSAAPPRGRPSTPTPQRCSPTRAHRTRPPPR